MVTNHGLAVLVSDSPFFGPISESINPQRGVERYALLGKRHGVVNVVSPVYRFFESLRDQQADAFISEELDIVAPLHGEGDNGQNTLKNTFGAFLSTSSAGSLSVEAADNNT
jgi:hypothetical protein